MFGLGQLAMIGAIAGGHHGNVEPLLLGSAVLGMIDSIVPHSSSNYQVDATSCSHQCNCTHSPHDASLPPPQIWTSKPLPITWNSDSHNSRLAALQRGIKVTDADRLRLQENAEAEKRCIQELHAREAATAETRRLHLEAVARVTTSRVEVARKARAVAAERSKNGSSRVTRPDDIRVEMATRRML